MSGFADPGFDTLALHAGAAPDPSTGARALPIHLSTSFVFESCDHAAALFNLVLLCHKYGIINPSEPSQELRCARVNGLTSTWSICRRVLGTQIGMPGSGAIARV